MAVADIETSMPTSPISYLMFQRSAAALISRAKRGISYLLSRVSRAKRGISYLLSHVSAQRSCAYLPHEVRHFLSPISRSAAAFISRAKRGISYLVFRAAQLRLSPARSAAFPISYFAQRSCAYLPRGAAARGE